MENSRIIFLVPNDNYFFSGNTFRVNGNKAINIDLPLFCDEMIRCVFNWWQTHKNNEIVKMNYEKIVKYRNDGMFPFIQGIPVIA